MKTVKHILAFVLALALLTSCGLLGASSNAGTAQTTNTSSTGITTGSALASIFNVLKNTGMLDLGNLTNLINLGQILLGANSLTNASQAYTDQFAQDLIAGSNRMINGSNVNNVISGLKKLAASDTSVLTKATNSAFAGNLVAVPNNNQNVKANLATIDEIMKAMK
jgi:hypothetical protein